MFILKKRAPFRVVVWGLLKTFFLKIPKFVWIGCLSRTMFEGGQKNKPHKFQTLLHPPTHTACPPPSVGLPLAAPSLSLGRLPKTGLQQQAQTVLTPPRQSQAVIFKPLRVFRNALCVPRQKVYFSMGCAWCQNKIKRKSRPEMFD